jgi:catechol-2,3-dioxygenase
VPAPAKLAHVVFKTGQIDAMVQWWTTVLEAEVVFSNPMIAFATYDDEHHRIAFIQAGTERRIDPGASGLEHVAFTYATLDDLLATYVRLRDLDITPYWTVNHGPTTSMYYEDPDGNHAELQLDNFASLEDLAEWFASGAFHANPIGVNFDPEVLVAQRAAGAPVAELVRQGSAPSPTA